jgi:glycosyltransferase involved in cell wall biosynthesis
MMMNGKSKVFNQELVSVLMPTYNQEKFVLRAIESLIGQSYKNWELLIINDGSPDNTQITISSYLTDERIRYFKLLQNIGLGAALNFLTDKAKGKYISYLPSDDVYYADHLQSLQLTLSSKIENILAYSGIRHHYNKSSNGIIDNYPLQLVQVMHKRTKEYWTERKDLESDDLNKLFWDKLKSFGTYEPTHQITCEWVDHAEQRHKLIREPMGGINPYRCYYKVKHPLRFHSTVGNLIDEIGSYSELRQRPHTPFAAKGLKILLVGELAYNPERILALEEQGHKLYGLWMKSPHWYNYIGPLPFGHVEDIDYDHWKEEIERIKPDIIYALLNWQAVPLAHEVLINNPGIPFVWNFKEGPFICLEKGTWNQLIDLYTKSHGQIYTSEEMRSWFATFLPDMKNSLNIILDGDLPRKDKFLISRTPLISETDGEIHTVVPGRPIGLHPEYVARLASTKIHLHFYGDFTQGQWKSWIEKTVETAKGYLHVHPNVTREKWVEEFSKYDAGWLHFFKSENCGEIRRANWDDLNIPARIAILALSGLPMLQRDNEGHLVATQSLVKKFKLGLFFKEMEDLASQIMESGRMKVIRENCWNHRDKFTFDYHADRLISFFHQVIKQSKKNINK